MAKFQEEYDKWLQIQISEESNPRRRELLEKGLGHGTVEFLRLVWFPVVGNFDDLYPEWEVLDFNNGYRYLDLAYQRKDARGCIEIQGYGPHARDLDVRRFKDLCWRHSLLSLDGWTILPIAYLSIKEETKQCQQLVLAFLGKFISMETQSQLSWLEAEVVRYARRLVRPITPLEIANHLKVGDRQARRILHRLVELEILFIVSGNKRARLYQLKAVSKH
ncbi:transcriptional regulator [Alkalihalobacterium chitinilyticum]|uniref:Transcriptional regulator n=1 Tax=Alkalihalobacterium chitinilyticum TaxID=2980103 RepID=A0ABT5VLU4_9BACI|nr:transcriptional regulator [Alkalihalobacterium chitinilyticum]MDE5416250.1 transcriptional regulator [Alkalihalobacterium chitinilyticum]